MKTYTFAVNTTALQEGNLEEVTGAPIKVLHGMSSYKQDDLTAIVTIIVTLETPTKTAKKDK